MLDTVSEDDWRNESRNRKEEDVAMKSVQLEAQVVLRIINHVRQVPPMQHAQGQLLGLDVDSVLHCTASFAYKNKEDEMADGNQEELTAYQMDMLGYLREVNVDSNTVGWYSATVGANLFPENFLEIQLATQRAVPKSVVLICDPNEAGAGYPAFKAYRLDLPRNVLNRHMDAASIPLSASLLQEVPITIRTSPLVELFFNRHVGPQVNHNFDSLNCDLGPCVESSLRHVFEGLQKLQAEQSQIYQYERQIRQSQKQRGFQSLPPPRPQGPVPGDTLLTTKLIQSHCKSIEKVANSSLSKLYLASREESTK